MGESFKGGGGMEGGEVGLKTEDGDPKLSECFNVFFRDCVEESKERWLEIGDRGGGLGGSFSTPKFG